MFIEDSCYFGAHDHVRLFYDDVVEMAFYHTSEMFYTKLFWGKPAAEQVSMNRFRTILKAFQNHFKCACECAELLSCGHAKGGLCHA